MTAEIEMNSSNLLKKIYLSIFLFIFAHERPAKRRKNIFHFSGLLIYCTFLKGESCNLIVMFKAHVLLAQTLHNDSSIVANFRMYAGFQKKS